MAEQARFMIEGSSYYSPLTAIRTGGAWYYPLYDKLGSTRRLADANQTVTDAYWYDAFGNITSQSGSTYNPYRYVGSLGYYSADGTTGLLHVGARYYSPQVGRFWTQDPGREGVNWYRYVANNPANAPDPSGHESRSIIDQCNPFPHCDPAAEREQIEARIQLIDDLLQGNLGAPVAGGRKVWVAVTECQCRHSVTTAITRCGAAYWKMSGCKRLCVNEHEEVHRQQCLRLGPARFARQGTWAAERPAYRTERMCLSLLLGAAGGGGGRGF
jgi:RHS repeat-associated protein